MSINYFYISLALLSFLLTFLIRKIAIKKNVVDIPNARSSHTVPTPRGGGLAIVICWYIGLGILFYLGRMDKSLFWALNSGIILAIVGIIDDVVSLKPALRLIFQFISSLLAIYFLGGFSIHFFESNYLVLNILFSGLAIIGMIWFINLYNFLDGIDAYASLEAIFVAAALFLFTGSPLTVILIASTVGFLIWNWPKAKIFMGDVGSTQLGFILIVLGIYFHNSNEFNFINWLMLTAVFWFDASFTLYRRWRNKEKLSVAHKKHAYQRIVQSGFSHLKTDLFSLAINAILLLLVFISIKFQSFTHLLFIFVIALLFGIVRKIDKLFPFKK